MARFLSEQGVRPLALDLVPSNGDLGLDALARQVTTFADERIPSGEQFDLVGFSMGGLVSRYYVQRLGGLERVTRVITISTPHFGTLWAHTARNPASRQMRRGSEFLAKLNRDTAMLERLRFASIWTPMDLMILPASSSRLGVGEDFRIPVALHAWMPGNRRCWELVARMLRQDAL